MSFKFAARTLLALGRELISSDDVALYELLKNAVDATSPRVEISVSTQLSWSHVREAIAQVTEEGNAPESVIPFIRRKLTDSTTVDSVALLDALAANCTPSAFVRELQRQHDVLNYIEVRDTGHGMSLSDLSDVFLRIGTDSRRKENLAGAHNLGDKGIGRLSAMRLGNRLEVKTSRCDDPYWHLLYIDWTRFSNDDNLDADEITIDPELGDEKLDPNDHGTTIRISALQADWDLPRFTDVLQGRISRMVDPFALGLANRLIVARHNGQRVQVPSIPTALLQAAHAVCHVQFRMIDNVPIIAGRVDYRYRQRQCAIEAKGSEVYSLSQKTIKRRAKRGHAASKLVPIRLSALQRLGSFTCDIYWYNRRVIGAVHGLTTNVTETRREISHWSGGPMLYRYGFRILPYGDPKDDWLALDETAFGEQGFKLNRQQVIGRVLLHAPHSALSEQTNREGLVDSDTSEALRKILLWVVHTEMRGLINEADDIELIERRAAEHGTEAVSKAKRRVDAALTRLRDHVGDMAKKEIDEVAQSVFKLSTQSQNLLERIEAVLQEADQERGKFVYLAGIGLMTEFIFHELERAVSYTMDLIDQGGIRRATITTLRDQLKTLYKRIAAFDELTGEKRQRKAHFDLVELVTEVLDHHTKEFDRHKITARLENSQGPFMIKAVRGMVIQILENLIVNSVYWLKQHERFERGFRPSLYVRMDLKSRTLTVEDNGPGVPKERSERIFRPFITTKPTGQGRGLGLYIARDMATYHGWTLRMTDEVGRIRSGRINAFCLELG